ncbi:MAG: hypothetical protein ABI797_05950 [Chloroflexota bacterium]
MKTSLPLLLLSLLALACAAPAATPSPSPTPTPSGPLLTIESRGGHCRDGPCGTTLILEFDGRVHESAKPPNELGVVEPDMVAALQQAIAEADFEEIRSNPFTDECPVNFDGQELVLEFATSDGVERLEGCQVAIDWNSPLFATVTTVMNPWFGR